MVFLYGKHAKLNDFLIYLQKSQTTLIQKQREYLTLCVWTPKLGVHVDIFVDVQAVLNLDFWVFVSFFGQLCLSEYCSKQSCWRM